MKVVDFWYITLNIAQKILMQNNNLKEEGTSDCKIPGRQEAQGVSVIEYGLGICGDTRETPGHSRDTHLHCKNLRGMCYSWQKPLVSELLQKVIGSLRTGSVEFIFEPSIALYRVLYMVESNVNKWMIALMCFFFCST